jgi:hypothetical protein
MSRVTKLPSLLYVGYFSPITSNRGEASSSAASDISDSNGYQ